MEEKWFGAPSPITIDWSNREREKAQLTAGANTPHDPLTIAKLMAVQPNHAGPHRMTRGASRSVSGNVNFADRVVPAHCVFREEAAHAG